MIKDVLYNVEGTKHWTPDPDITPEQLEEMRVDVLERIIVARVGLLLRHPFFGNMATRLSYLSGSLGTLPLRSDFGTQLWARSFCLECLTTMLQHALSTQPSTRYASV